LSLVVRAAQPEDAQTILGFIRALAEYERLASRMKADEQRIRDTFFGKNPRVFCNLAEIAEESVGFSVWFYNYSTFLGRHGIWLEDIFVKPERRGRGVGKALFGALAERCRAENLGRLEWSVLDWNRPSIEFYRSLGAECLDDWRTYCLTGAALARLAASAA
jgi:GNAT superfamily N-acetyltransferase